MLFGGFDELGIQDSTTVGAPSPDGPTQACADDAGPAWADDADVYPGTTRVVGKLWQIFGKMSLVFGCIGIDLCKQIRVLQRF